MLPKSTSLLDKAAEHSFVRALYLHTPALTAGANNTMSQRLASDLPMAEARLSSILGVLRFWWRVTKGQAYQPDDRRRREIAIFGGPAAEEKLEKQKAAGGVGCFSGNLMVSAGSNAFQKAPITVDDNLLQLLGNGVTSNRDAALPVGEFGNLSLHFHPSPLKDPKHRTEVLFAMDFLCAFGGIGLLGRRGLGSISTFAPGARNLTDAIADNNRLLAELEGLQSAVTQPGRYRMVNWPVDKESSIEALAVFASHLKRLRIKSDTDGSIERLSDLLSSQASLRRALKSDNRPPSPVSGKDTYRRPSPVFVKVLSCVHEGRPVQLITALLVPTGYLSEFFDKAPMTLSARLNLVFDSLETVAAGTSVKFPGAFA